MNGIDASNGRYHAADEVRRPACRSRDADVTGPQGAAWAVLALAALTAAGITVLVWPRLFDSTPDGVGKLAHARCEGLPTAGCTVSALEISPGRLWLEARYWTPFLHPGSFAWYLP